MFTIYLRTHGEWSPFTRTHRPEVAANAFLALTGTADEDFASDIAHDLASGTAYERTRYGSHGRSVTALVVADVSPHSPLNQEGN